jgi:dynein heavy chain
MKEYYIPPEGPLQSYRDYISTLPMQDQAEAFGQHPNADISYMITGRASHMTTLQLNLSCF